MSTEATTTTAASTTATTPQQAPQASAQATPVTPPPEAPKAAEAPAEKPPAARDWNAIRAQEARLAREREALKAQAKEAQEAKARADRLAELAKTGKYDDLAKELGVSYDAWTKARLNAKKTPEEMAREAAKAEAQRLIEERERAAEEARQAEQEKALEAHWQNVTKTFGDHVGKSGEAHELLRAELESDADGVHATLRAMAEQRPDLTIEQAADLYEQFLVEQTKRRLGLGKVRALVQPTASAEGAKPSDKSPEAESGRDGSAHGARTLTNGIAQERVSAASEPKNANRHRAEREEAEERIRRALARVS